MKYLKYLKKIYGFHISFFLKKEFNKVWKIQIYFIIYMSSLILPIKIETKKGLSLIMNDTLMHRVLPVLSGVRYSLVCFFDMTTKNEKTII